MAVSMLEFLKISPDAAPLIMDLVAKNMDFPGAEEISKRLKNTVPPNVLADPDDPESQPPPPPDPMDDPTVRVELEYKTAQARKAMADAMKAEMEAAQMQQMAIQPQVIEPEIIDPRDEAIKDAQARKAMADAAMAELGVQNYQPPVPPQGGPGVDPSQLPAAPVDAYSPPDMGATQ
jgi:hypothetical protein